MELELILRKSRFLNEEEKENLRVKFKSNDQVLHVILQAYNDHQSIKRLYGDLKTEGYLLPLSEIEPKLTQKDIPDDKTRTGNRRISRRDPLLSTETTSQYIGIEGDKVIQPSIAIRLDGFSFAEGEKYSYDFVDQTAKEIQNESTQDEQTDHYDEVRSYRIPLEIREKEEQLVRLINEYHKKIDDLTSEDKSLRDREERVLQREMHITPYSRPIYDENAPINRILSMKYPLGLHDVHCIDMANLLKSLFRYKEKISFSEFAIFMEQVVPSTLPQPLFEEILNRIFDFADFDQDNLVDKNDISNLMIILSNGDRDDQIRALFMVYDKDQDDLLRSNELRDYITSIIKFQEGCGAEEIRMTPEGADELAMRVSAQIIGQKNTNIQDGLTLREFSNWVGSGKDLRAIGR